MQLAIGNKSTYNGPQYTLHSSTEKLIGLAKPQRRRTACCCFPLFEAHGQYAFRAPVAQSIEGFSMPFFGSSCMVWRPFLMQILENYSFPFCARASRHGSLGFGDSSQTSAHPSWLTSSLLLDAPQEDGVCL